MKYASRKVAKPKYKIGTKVYVTGLFGNPMGRITKDNYDGGWKYKVHLYNSKSTPKYWNEKSLRKVRSDKH